MVEGCNAVSVIILFVSFVFAFYKGMKTFVFVGAGLIILYIMNLLRIVGLNIVMTDHKEYGKIFHDFIFPAIIYGSVVVLWLIWIKFFALKHENS
jgi:exosortase family protein XrtF